ncbi:hypothetical protein [Streptomyces sp. NPDC055056]
MRSARLLLATASATAALAIAAPGAHAGDRDNSCYSSEHYDNSGRGEELHGGMHTGGGALTTVNEDDWSEDKESNDPSQHEPSTDDEYKKAQDKGEHEDADSGYKHEQPHGGMHTGGGGLSTPTGGMAAGSTALLIDGLGAGAYMLRRRNKTTPTA